MSPEGSKSLIVCCKHAEILATLLRVIQQKSHHTAFGCSSMEELKKLLSDHHTDIILIGSGFTDDEENQIALFVKQNYPALPVVFHYGGGSGLLFSEIRSATDQTIRPSFR